MKIGFLLFLFAFMSQCFASPAASNTLSQVKAFLEHPPTIKTLEFAVLSKVKEGNVYYSPDGKLFGHLFTASLQGDNFVIATLTNRNDVPHMFDGTPPIAGKLDSFRWSIIGITLYLGDIDAENSQIIAQIDKLRQISNPKMVVETNKVQIFSPTNDSQGISNPAVRLSVAKEIDLNIPMTLGIFHADRGTIQVSESGEFSAPSSKLHHLLFGKPQSEIKGKFIISSEGVLTGAIWQNTSMPNNVFHIEYSYQNDREPHFPPTEWECSDDDNGQTYNMNYVKIYKFETVSTNLSSATFLPIQFIDKAKLPDVAPIVLIQSNNQTLWLQNGKFNIANMQNPTSEDLKPHNRYVFFLIFSLANFIPLGYLIKSWWLKRQK